MEDFMGFKVDDQEKININESCQCSEDPTTIKEQDDHDQVESTRSEMAIAREENARLKTLLQRVERDYKALQLRFVSVFQQDQSKKIELSPITNIRTEEEISADHDDDDREDEVLVSLRLGTSTSPRTETHKKEESRLRNIVNPGPDNCSSTAKKENDRASPGKAVLKTERSGDEEVSQTSVKRARVCVRARCDTPTMNDGGQWRKYGQKIAKGNPCPRAYYRCTVSPTCPVRKQVQRCVEDMSILITTYEGTHNHTVPVSAIAMASTTSAAASMLLSGSSSTTSQPPPTAPPPHNLFAPSPPTFHPYQPYFLPNSSSSSTPFPTITLDLTTANPSTTHGGFGLYSSTSRPNPRVPPPTSLSFSSMDSNMVVPTVWGGGGFSNYGNFPYKNDHRYSQPSPGKPAEEQKYQSYLEKFNQASSSQQAITETLTKVITSDASFRSVIAAAISTMATNGKVNNDVKGENLGTNLNWGEHINPAADFDPLT